MEGVMIFSWIRYNRPDVEWFKGPDSSGNYSWDNTLPNTQQIITLINDFINRTSAYEDWYYSPEQVAARQQYNTSILIKARKEYADDLLERFKNRNISQGISLKQGFHMHSRMRALDITISGSSYTLDIMNMAVSGDIELACVALQYCSADDMSSSDHWLNTERISWLVNDMKAFLGWP
jgi:hypothetical protein